MQPDKLKLLAVAVGLMCAFGGYVSLHLVPSGYSRAAPASTASTSYDQGLLAENRELRAQLDIIHSLQAQQAAAASRAGAEDVQGGARTPPPPSDAVGAGSAGAADNGLAKSNFVDTGFSLSSQGKLFSAVRTRAYSGKREFDSPQASRSAPRRRYSAVAGQRNCTKWAVFTTIFAPSVATRQMAALQDWCTVIVGDKKSPKSYSIDAADAGSSEAAARAEQEGRLVYLTPAKQEALPYTIIPILKWNHFGRKNIGFLYALHHGAQLIYDVDDDNILKSGQLPTDLGRVMSTEPNAVQPTLPELEIEAGVYVYNPYAESFKSHSKGERAFSWQRGFPLEEIRNARTYQQRDAKMPTAPRGGAVTILQSLADHDPDIDAIYRLTQKLPLGFENSAKGAGGQAATKLGKVDVVPPNVMSPFNAQAVVFARPAFWGMLMPVTVHGRVTDIWRSYFTQRLQWDVGQRLAFCAPFVTQCRNPHSYLADFDGESDLYTRSGSLVRLLLEWKPKADTLAGRVEEMAVLMYETDLLHGERDVRLYSAWLRDLEAVGYAFPPLVAEHHQPPGSVKATIPDPAVTGACEAEAVSTAAAAGSLATAAAAKEPSQVSE